MRTKTIGLKRCRKAAGMTQNDLAKKSRISQSLICKYELGELVPSEKTVNRLAEALGIESGELYLDGLENARSAAEYLGISAEAALKLRNMGQTEKNVFDGMVRGYTA